MRNKITVDVVINGKEISLQLKPEYDFAPFPSLEAKVFSLLLSFGDQLKRDFEDSLDCSVVLRLESPVYDPVAVKPGDGDAEDQMELFDRKPDSHTRH